MTRRKAAFAITCLLLTAALCLLVARSVHLPGGLGEPEYIRELASRTGALNLVASIYLDGRLYDTIFELIVFSVAVLGVRFYLSERRPSHRPAPIPESHVVRASAEALFPFLLLLGIYLAAYGHLSPGGGFAGGTVAASGLMLCSIAIGVDAVARRIHRPSLERLEWALPLTIISLAIVPVLLGRPPLAALFPPRGGGGIFSSGSILLYNLLIGIKVFIGSWVVVHGFIEHRGEI